MGTVAWTYAELHAEAALARHIEQPHALITVRPRLLRLLLLWWRRLVRLLTGLHAYGTCQKQL